jgi:putative ABC transport system ATP-binding protein
MTLQEEKTAYTVVAKNIYKSFYEEDECVHALRGVSINVKPNELLMIVGPSGCGKTTLISVIAGTLHFDSGTVEVLGHALNTMTVDEITKFRATNVGFIFQKHNLLHQLTNCENVAIPLLVNGMKIKDAIEKAYLALELVGQADKAYRFPKELSGGQQQLIAIARSIVHEPNIVFCDEPTSSLDIVNGMRVMRIMKKLASHPGRSVIVVSHDHRIYPFANRIVAINDGVIESVTIPEHNEDMEK